MYFYGEKPAGSNGRGNPQKTKRPLNLATGDMFCQILKRSKLLYVFPSGIVAL
jgi:hypothetical protein